MAEVEIRCPPRAAAAHHSADERLPSGPPARRGRTRDPSRPAHRHQGPARSISIAVSHENRDGHLLVEPERPRPKNDLCRSAHRTAGAAAVPARGARGPVRRATTASAGPAIRPAHSGCGMRRRAVLTPAPRARYRPVDFATTNARPAARGTWRDRGGAAAGARTPQRTCEGRNSWHPRCLPGPQSAGRRRAILVRVRISARGGARRPGKKSQGVQAAAAGCSSCCCFAPRAWHRGGKRACSRARTPHARRSEVCC